MPTPNTDTSRVPRDSVRTARCVDRRIAVMRVPNWRSAAYDRVWLVWHKVDEAVPRKQDSSDDVDAGAHDVVRRVNAATTLGTAKRTLATSDESCRPSSRRQ